jgi:hypothetical protein
MDGVIGPAIGAVIALASVFVTAKLTFKNNSKLEEQKLIRQKREEAYTFCEKCRNSLAKQDVTMLNFVINARYESTGEFEVDKLHPHNHLKMLIFLYHPKLRADMERLDGLASKYQKYFSHYVKAHTFATYTEDEKKKFIRDASSISNQMHEIISSIKEKLINE